MQITEEKKRLIKGRLKEKHRGQYALLVVFKLRKQGITTTLQQVYNFFNGINASNRDEIINAALELLNEKPDKSLKQSKKAA
jgi:hypothetical protein